MGRLPLLLLLVPLTTVHATDPFYNRLLGKSQFKNQSEIEQFIMHLQELNKLQTEILGLPEPASDVSGRPALDYIGKQMPLKPDLLPYLFEGDIILSKEQMAKMISEKKKELEAMKTRTTRSLTSDTSLRWQFPIAYWIDTSTGVSTSAVAAGIAKWEQITCVTFRQYSSQPVGRPSLRFIRGDGCYSYIGQITQSSTQEVSIGTGCTSLGTVTHEIGHALGFYHEQSRPERDRYVSIQTQNIGASYLSQFTKQSPASAVNYGVQYDYGSVMHYDGYGFTSDGGPTILTRESTYQATIGQREQPSFADVKQINFAYCNSSCYAQLDCKNGGYTDPKDCSVCRCPTGYGGTLCDGVQASLSNSCGEGTLFASTSPKTVSVSGDTDCYYLITAPARQQVRVTFSTIAFPSYTPCTISYAEIKYRANPVLSGARICGSNRPTSITSESNTLVIAYNGASTSQLVFAYSAIGTDTDDVEPTTAVPVSSSSSTSTTTAAPTTTTTAAKPTTKPTTTTTRPVRTTTKPWWAVTPAPTCTGWTFCTASCGGCGVHSRWCNGRLETDYCNSDKPCRNNSCCRPFTFHGGKCIRKGSRPNQQSEVETATNTVPVPETTIKYTATEEEKHTLHVQPPEFPLVVTLPPELLNMPHETVITVPPPVEDPPKKNEIHPIEQSTPEPSSTHNVQDILKDLKTENTVATEGPIESSTVTIDLVAVKAEVPSTVVLSEAEEKAIVDEFKKEHQDELLKKPEVEGSGADNADKAPPAGQLPRDSSSSFSSKLRPLYRRRLSARRPSASAPAATPFRAPSPDCSGHPCRARGRGLRIQPISDELLAPPPSTRPPAPLPRSWEDAVRAVRDPHPDDYYDTLYELELGSGESMLTEDF